MLVNEDERKSIFRIVDGQQRFTTSMVFFIALRDYFLEFPQGNNVEDLESLIYYEDENGDRNPRLQLNRYNNPYFKDMNVGLPGIIEKTEGAEIE